MLTQQQSELLQRMKLDNVVAKEPYVPLASGWAKLCTRFNDVFMNEGITTVEDQLFNRYFACADPKTQLKVFFEIARSMMLHSSTWRVLKADDYVLACTLLYEYLRARDNNKILDKTNPSRSTNVVTVDNKEVSWDYLLSVDNAITLTDKIPSLLTEKAIIVDLGAGWGRIGHVFKTLNPKLTYIIADLPEILLISQTYLPTTLPDEKVFGYDDHAALEQITRSTLLAEPSIRFCGTQHLAKFEDKSIDVLINVASMQEMNQNTIKLYFDLIDHKAQYFYTAQGNEQYARYGTGFPPNEWPYPISWQQLHHNSALIYWTSSAFDTLLKT
jgi:putative sugar O-methyltransferase